MADMDKRKGALLVAVSAAAFGLMPVFSDMAVSAGAGTFTMLFLRFMAGAAFMFLLISIRKLPMFSVREMIVFFLFGAVWYVGHSICFFTALRHASAGVVSLLFYTYPALVMLDSVIFLKEKISAVTVTALVLALAGAFVIIGAEFEASPAGILLSAACSVLYSAYLVVNSKLVKPGMTVQSSAFTMLGAGCTYGILSLMTGFEPPLTYSGWAGILLISLVSTVIAMWALYTGMESTGAVAASLISILEPVVTVASSVLLLGEKLTWNKVAGGLLVLAAVAVASFGGGGESGKDRQMKEDPSV